VRRLKLCHFSGSNIKETMFMRRGDNSYEYGQYSPG
jgi:hypothetical protein